MDNSFLNRRGCVWFWKKGQHKKKSFAGYTFRTTTTKKYNIMITQINANRYKSNGVMCFFLFREQLVISVSWIKSSTLLSCCCLPPSNSWPWCTTAPQRKGWPYLANLANMVLPWPSTSLYLNPIQYYGMIQKKQRAWQRKPAPFWACFMSLRQNRRP